MTRKCLCASRCCPLVVALFRRLPVASCKRGCMHVHWHLHRYWLLTHIPRFPHMCYSTSRPGVACVITSGTSSCVRVHHYSSTGGYLPPANHHPAPRRGHGRLCGEVQGLPWKVHERPPLNGYQVAPSLRNNWAVYNPSPRWNIIPQSLYKVLGTPFLNLPLTRSFFAVLFLTCILWSLHVLPSRASIL